MKDNCPYNYFNVYIIVQNPLIEDLKLLLPDDCVVQVPQSSIYSVYYPFVLSTKFRK